MTGQDTAVEPHVPGTTVHGLLVSRQVTPFWVTAVPGVADVDTWKVSVPTTVPPGIGEEVTFLKIQVSPEALPAVRPGTPVQESEPGVIGGVRIVTCSEPLTGITSVPDMTVHVSI
jgi:hypothetical protein